MADAGFEKKLRADLPRGMEGIEDRGLLSRWAAADELTGPWDYKGDGLLLGKLGGRRIGWNDNRHVLTVAGSRAGKGVSLIIPNLIFYPGSVFVIDPKGENAFHTAKRREQIGQRVHVLDPFGVSDCKLARFNPLADLDLDDRDLIEDAGVFADALIEHPPTGERYWTESAQGLIRALILLTLAQHPHRRNLITMRRLLMLTDQAITRRIKQEKYNHPKSDKRPPMERQAALWALLSDQKGKRHGDVCAGVAEQFKSLTEKELGSVLSTARSQTQWLDDRRIQSVLRRSDFRMRDLKTRPTSIYLCLPAMRMGTHAKWLRLMILHALNVMERTPNVPGPPALFVLDEFPVLGYLRSIEVAAGLMAGFGVKLWTIVQNIGQLKQHYKASWETFFANAGLMTAFGVIDHESQTAITAKLGKFRMVEKVATGAVGSALLAGDLAEKENHYDIQLLAEDEIGRVFAREKNRMIALGAGYPPAIIERFIYFDDPLFKGLYRDRVR